MTATARTALQVLWPSFAAAAVLELLVFAHVDPADVRTLAGTPLELSREAVQTLSFLAFWAAAAAAAAVSAWLQHGVPDRPR